MGSKLSKSVWLLWKRVEAIESVLRRNELFEIEGAGCGALLPSTVGVVARPKGSGAGGDVPESATALAPPERPRATTPTVEGSTPSCPRPEAGELSEDRGAA